MASEQSVKLNWDSGTGYDLFISLEVLHNPEEFDLRGSWAAGVRSRVPTAERKVLEDANMMMHVPLPWIYSLPEPKDVGTVLWTLRQLPAEKRLAALLINYEVSRNLEPLYQEVSSRRSWNEKDRDRLQSHYGAKKRQRSAQALATMLDWWSRPDEFGEILLAALQSYHQEFFAEEERRIQRTLYTSLEQAQEKSQKTGVVELIEELSQGVHFTNLSELSELTLIPSFWSTPLVFFDKLSEDRMLLTYGARPANASLVPGEMVPDALLQGLKALADPTRLRILRYLTDRPLSPAELSRRLRLRAPTVVHHLHDLRIAGLVHLYVEESGERRYAVRQETTQVLFAILQEFLNEANSYSSEV